MAGAEKLYMQSPLVRWVENFKANDGHPLEYRDLYDGVFLIDVMQQIDHRLAVDNVNRCVEDVSARLHNWGILVKSIQGYYRDVLQQLLVMRLPNISAICREPGKDSSFAEVRKALLLILGCAVQCEQKEHFIDKIMALDITTQTEIVENIKEVTDDCKTILPIQIPQSSTDVSSYVDKMFQHLCRLIQERDECAELAADVGQERDYYMLQAEGRPVIDSPQKSPDKHHLALELAECKAKLRHQRQELEDKQEQLLDVKEELQANLTICTGLKSKNASLIEEARVTRLLRDEVDILKEKAMKVDVFEKEILKYKEKLNELEFYRARTEELKEDNSILEETKAMLEDQLTNSRKRIETVVELESKLERCRQQIQEFTAERDSDRAKIEYLTEENARLEFEKKSSMNESVTLESELSMAKSVVGKVGSSLSEQLSETSHTRILRLELENQRLAAKLAEMKETALIHSAEVSLQLEKENQRLAKKVEKLQANIRESSEQLILMESELVSSKEERDRLLKSMDVVSEKSDQQVQELEKENEQLSQALHEIRERVEKTSDLKVKDLEKDNRRLQETVTTKNSQLNKLEFDNRQLQRSYHQFLENTRRVQELEQENQILEKENAELHLKVATLQHAADKLEAIEQESSDLSVENHKLQKTVELLQRMTQRREQEEQDHISLTLEHQRLQRTLESLKSESDRAVELESEKNDLLKELQQLKKQLEGQRTQKLKQEQMEIEIIHMGNENQRLQKTLEVTTMRLQQLEKDNIDMESDKEQISKELEALRMTVKRLEEKDEEASLLEVEVLQLQKDKSSLEKENKKLKQSLDVKDSSLEETNAKVLSLNQELKSQRQAVERMKETCSKVKDLEKENKEMLQELHTDRRTLTTLREDLVNEKIRSQELSNELEQLTSELEKVGIDTAKLTMVEQTKDANRYKALETMIEETLKKSSELKEKKIVTLENKLEESKSRNVKLQEDLRTAKRERDILRQRMEEEVTEKVAVDDRREAGDRSGRLESSSAAKELFQLKDHLVELERQNATLLAETDNLRSNHHNTIEQCQKLETQLSNLHSQHAALQNHFSSLQEQNAKLQVECTALQSQTSSALSQKDTLKNQLACLETEYENLAHKYEGLQNTHTSFVSDHESLQHLHQQLTSEYESLVAEHGSLKSLHKSLKVQLKDLQEQHEVLFQGKDDVNKLRDVMEKERDHLKRELNSLGNLQAEHHHLRESHHQLRSAFDKLSKDYSNVLASHKQVKTDYNTLQLKATELQGELSEAKENLSVADMEFQKLENKMETAYQMNERIDNENQALLMQIKQLLNQNHELLMQALNSKDHFAEEEKAYLEKLSDLRRQKERLEEKIMDHYKNRISPKKKGLGALIARKARGIMSKGTRRSKSRNNLAELTDNFSQGLAFPEQTSDGPHTLGARSTEDINTSANADGGFLSGQGRLYSANDGHMSRDQQALTAGSVRKIQGQPSQENEMLTLKQFLMEAAESNVSDDSVADELRSHELSKHHMNSDSESRKSDHSSTSGSLHHHHLQTQPQHVRNGSAKSRQDVPDALSLGSPVTREISTSKISHHSTESGSESSCFDSDVLPGDVFTSTPKIDGKTSHGNIYRRAPSSRLGSGSQEHQSASSGSQIRTENHLSGNGFTNISQERSSSAISRWVNMNQQSSSLPINHVSQSQTSINQLLSSQIPASISQAFSSQAPAPNSQPLSSHYQQHFLSQPSHHSMSTYNNRVTETSADQLPDCPDRLIITASQQDHSSAIYAQPYVHLSADADKSDQLWSRGSRNSNKHSSNSRDVDKDLKDVPGTELGRRKSQGAVDKKSESSSNYLQPSQLLSQQRTPYNNDSQILANEDLSGHLPRRPLSHALANQNLQQRTRPASVMSQSSHIRGVYSRPPGEGRPKQHQSRSSGQKEQIEFSNGGRGSLQTEQRMNNSRSQNSRPHVIERSKSVPPLLFNKLDDSDDELRRDFSVGHTSKTRTEQEIRRRDEVEQVPDGGDYRATQSFSNISLIRAPSRGRSSSRPVSQSHESQDLRQTYHNQPTSDPQQQHYPHPGSQTPVSSNRQSNMEQAAQMSYAQQKPPQAPQYQSANRPSPQLNSSGQFSSSRPDFLPLTNHEQYISRSEYQRGRQNSGLDFGVNNQSPGAPLRSQSSIGNPSGSTPSSVLSPANPYDGMNTMSSSNFSPGEKNVRNSTPRNFSPGQQNVRNSTPRNFSPGQQNVRNSMPTNFSPGQQNVRSHTPSNFSPEQQNIRSHTPSNFSPAQQNIRSHTPSNFSPAQQNVRSNTPSNFSPGQQNIRNHTPSNFSPGQPYVKNTTPSTSSPGQSYIRSSSSSTSLSPSASYLKGSIHGFHPGRRELSSSQHGNNDQDEISSYQGDGHTIGPSSDFHIDPSVADRDLMPAHGVDELRGNAPYLNSYSPSQLQPVTNIHSSASNAPQPPPRTSSRGPSQYRRSVSPTNLDNISNGSSGQYHPISQPQQQHTVAAQGRCQERQSSTYLHNNNQSQRHSMGQLNTLDQTADLSSSHSHTSQVSPPLKTTPNIPVSEKEADAEQPKTANSVWSPR